MTRTTPLLQRPEDAPLVWLSKSLNGLAIPADGQRISNRQFLAHVNTVAQCLPSGDYALNLCDNRYIFMVAMCAVIVAQQTNLLPPNKNQKTQENLLARYKKTYALHDGHAELPADALQFDLSSIDWSLSTFDGAIPDVSLDHLAVISFTSGSTGDSKPNAKFWSTLQESSRINARYMLPNKTEIFYHLATVPGQHMWGLETSVLLPMFANACLVDARPLYPHDIRAILCKLPTPKTLIATPLHLRMLSAAQEISQSPTSRLENVLCATAPLDPSLAQKVESQFGCQLREVYGCSEVGSMSVRRTAQTELWSKFSGLTFSQASSGKTTVIAGHLPQKVALEDTLDMVGEDQFRLSGRASDQIKIAGKRGSLAEVNAVLARYSGFLDGVVFFPKQDRPVPRLVAIVSITENSKEALRDHFKRYLDPAFVPRPIYLVKTLPREENGKVIGARIQELYEALSKT